MIDETRFDEGAKFDILVEQGADICFVIQDLDFDLTNVIITTKIYDNDNILQDVNFTTTKDLTVGAQTLEFYLNWTSISDFVVNSSYYYTSIIESGNGLKSPFLKGILKIANSN